MYISLKYFNVVMAFMYSIWLTVVKAIFYKECVYCHKYLFMKLYGFLGGFNNVPFRMNLFLPIDLPF